MTQPKSLHLSVVKKTEDFYFISLLFLCFPLYSEAGLFHLSFLENNKPLSCFFVSMFYSTKVQVF